MKITRILQPAITEEVEITFPFYRESNEMFYYKVVNEKNVTQVTINKHAMFNGIENGKYIPDIAFHENSAYITEQEFEAKFNECIELLTNLKNQ